MREVNGNISVLAAGGDKRPGRGLAQLSSTAHISKGADVFPAVAAFLQLPVVGCLVHCGTIEICQPSLDVSFWNQQNDPIRVRPWRDAGQTTGVVQLGDSPRQASGVPIDHDNQYGIHVRCAERPQLVRVLLATKLLTGPSAGRRGNPTNSVIGLALQEAIDKDPMLLVFAKNDDLRRLHGAQPRA